MTRSQVEEILTTETQAKQWAKKNQGARGEDEDDDDGGAVGENKGEKQESAPVSTSPTWRYKWEPNGEVYGPYSSEQMNAWANEGHFAAGVLVCKEGTEDYVPSKRVDFSLYIDD